MVDQLLNLGLYQWAGLVFGLFYIFYAVRNNPLCWIFGILSCSAIAVEDFIHTKLYADGVLQVFYVGISLVGFYKWKLAGSGKKITEISTWPSKYHIIHIALGLICSALVAKMISIYTDAAFPFLDTATTIFSVTTTFLLVYRIIDNWIYWILIDIVYVMLYYHREAPLFSILYIIFCGMAVVGYISWKKEMLKTGVPDIK